MPPARRRQARTSWGRRLFYSVAPLVVLAVGGELALRLAGWPKATNATFAHNEVYWITDPNLVKQPRDHKEMGTTFAVTTDANGLRAPNHPEEKPDGVFRVMTLGCSTTFGWGVDDDESYPARLEALLQGDGHKVEVINGGQPGYTSFQGLWLWDRTLKLYHPDLVIFGYIVQDARKVAYSDKSQAILQHNADFLKENVLYQLRLFLGLRELVDHFRIQQKESGEVYRVPPDEYVENIRAFKERIEAVGAKMMFFGFPLEREGYTEEHRVYMHAAADQLGLPIYDPQKEVEAATNTQTLFFPADRGHANVAGCDWIAHGMERYLVDQKLVP